LTSNKTKSDLRIIFELIEKGDFRDIGEKIISAKCGCGCNHYAINTPKENEEFKLVYNISEKKIIALS